MRHEDVLEIIETINRYALAVDSQQFALFDHVFTEDTVADYGPGAVWNDLASLKRDFEPTHARFQATQHVTTNHNVTVDGDTAHSLTYVVGRFIREVDEGENWCESGAWYDDTLVRTSAGWRIKRRVCRGVWGSGNPRVMNPNAEGPDTARLAPLSREAAAGRLEFLNALNENLARGG